MCFASSYIQNGANFIATNTDSMYPVGSSLMPGIYNIINI